MSLQAAHHRHHHQQQRDLPGRLPLFAVHANRVVVAAVVVDFYGVFPIQGLDELPDDMSYAPVTSLTPLAHYEKIVEAFGGKGYFVSKPADLLPTLKTAFAQKVCFSRCVVRGKGDECVGLDAGACDRQRRDLTKQ
jgi:hypothetical protein